MPSIPLASLDWRIEATSAREKRGIRSKWIAHSSADRIPHSELSLLTLIATVFPRRNEVHVHLSLGSMEIAQLVVRAAAVVSL